MERGKLERVTRGSPCQICGKPDYCCVLDRYYWCMRVESDRPHRKGGWLHPKDADALVEPYSPPPKKTPDWKYRLKWAEVAFSAAEAGASLIHGLAAELGVSSASLTSLGVGYSDHLGGSPCWTFPERNSRGWIVGIQRRLVSPMDGRGKLCCVGSRRGLTFAPNWAAGNGPIYLVEGGTDTAAMMTMGLSAIGRPSNVGGVNILARMLRRRRDRRVVVVGERDRKPQERVVLSSPLHDAKCPGCQLCWPGLYGMKATALELTKRLRRHIEVMMPPCGAKDVRDWFSSAVCDPECRSACLVMGRIFSGGL
ncbi:MAG TPA: hypothetical protein VM537_13425 [Anaerolineae bacterium]|nr:hypothetical protein [Anaerolineae bacterium]